MVYDSLMLKLHTNNYLVAEQPETKNQKRKTALILLLNNRPAPV
jgi:hypothetical protein